MNQAVEDMDGKENRANDGFGWARRKKVDRRAAHVWEESEAIN